jgi:hypothetical protein
MSFNKTADIPVVFILKADREGVKKQKGGSFDNGNSIIDVSNDSLIANNRF